MMHTSSLFAVFFVNYRILEFTFTTYIFFTPQTDFVSFIIVTCFIIIFDKFLLYIELSLYLLFCSVFIFCLSLILEIQR